MSVEEDIIFLIFNSIQTFILYKFLSGVLFKERKLKKSLEFASYFLAFVISSFFSIFFDLPIITLTISLVSTFLLSFCYKSKISYKFLTVLLSQALFLIVEIIVHFLLAEIFPNDNYTLGQLLSLAAKFIIVYSLASRKKQKQFRESAMTRLPIQSTLLLSLIPIVSISSLTVMVLLDSFTGKLILVYATNLLIINIFCFEVYNIVRASLIRDLRMKLRDSDSRHNKLHYEIVKDQIVAEKIRRHTLKDYLLLLKVSSEDELVNEVVNQLLNENYLIENVVATGNQILDDILNLKISMAKAYQVDYIIDINIPKRLNVDEGILITLISQIWEISLELAKYSKNSVLRFELVVEEDKLTIRTKCGFNAELEDKTYLDRLALCNPLVESIGGDIISTKVGSMLSIQMKIPIKHRLFSNRVFNFS